MSIKTSIKMSIKMSINKIIFAGFAMLVSFSALAFGTVEPWSILIFEVLAAALFLVWLISLVVTRSAEIRIPALFWPLLVYTILGILQMLSAGQPDLLAGVITVSPSIDAHATQGVIMVLITLLAIILLTGAITASEQNLNLGIILLSCYGFGLALFALIQHFGWNGRFYWLRAQELSNSIPFGPFANRNHFAGYMELLLPWPLVAILDNNRRREFKLFYASSAVWIGLAAVWTQSRGGIISLLTEVVVLALLAQHINRDQQHQSSSSGIRRFWQYFALAIVLAVIIAGTFWLGNEQLISRLTPASGSSSPVTVDDPQKKFSSSRGLFWKAAWNTFIMHPVTGAGLGSFQVAFQLYSPQPGPDPTVAHAHNDYLQVLADSGIIGAICLLWAVVVLVRNWRRGLLSLSASERACALAGCAVMSGLMVHSIFDFNLQLPSHSLLFVIFGSIEAAKQ